VIKFAAVLVLLGALLAVAIQNPHPVTVNFLAWKSMSTTLLVVVLVGLLVGLVGGFFIGFRTGKRDRPIEEEEDDPE